MQHSVNRLNNDGEKDLLVMRHDIFVTGDVARITHMNNFRKNVDFEELVLGKV